ncbi:hypothetical protein U1Q18_025754, partial [Sarracenia purpurea var. burkii]
GLLSQEFLGLLPQSFSRLPHTSATGCLSCLGEGCGFIYRWAATFGTSELPFNTSIAREENAGFD